MSLTPFAHAPKYEKAYMNFSKAIQFNAYVMMSRLSENRYESDLIDHFFKIDYKVWLTFGISLLILYIIGSIHKIMFKTLEQINYWSLIRIILNQSKENQFFFNDN